jgi:hypothetical protein
MINNVFNLKIMTIQKLRKFDFLHKKSFFLKREFEFAFSNFNFETFNMIITILINILKIQI